MGYRKSWLVLCVVFSALLAVAAPIETDKCLLVGNSERYPLEYRIGDELKFTIDLRYTGRPYSADDYEIIWKRSGDDGIVRIGRLSPRQLPYTFTDRFTKPGFIRFRAELHHKGGKMVRGVLGKGSLPSPVFCPCGISANSCTPLFARGGKERGFSSSR